MKKEIKIKFHSAVSQQKILEISEILNENYSINICEDYEYYLATEHIYLSKKNMNELLSSRRDAIRIILCGEAIYPDLNLFDYAIWYFRHFKSQDRVLESPFFYTKNELPFTDIKELDASKNNINPKDILKGKKDFCNFIYANPDAHPMRDKLFYELSKYKFVNSLGMHLKNTEIEDSRYTNDWVNTSVKLKAPYKFSIAVENSEFPGYTSEKLLTSMMAMTVPIYFGNPYVGELFNVKSFINVSDFNSLDECIQYIKRVDQDDDLYCQIMKEPWRTPEQIADYKKRYVQYKDKLNNIFAIDKNMAMRRPKGTWGTTIYPKFIEGCFAKNGSESKLLLNKMISAIKSIF